MATAVSSISETAAGPDEMALRADLAACYRLVAHFGMDDLVFTHISARVPGPDDHFLINRHGLLFTEITASNLVKIDLEGNVVGGEGPAPKAGFVIHGAIHAARKDAGCVLHTHTPAGVAVSCLEQGLMTVSQHSLRFIDGVGYHDFEGLAVDFDERKRLVAALGDNNVLIMRNHGLLTVGATVADAFVNMYRLNQTCEMQMALLATGQPIRPLPQNALDRFRANQQKQMQSAAGGFVWPALLRLIEHTDYRD